MLKMEAVAYPKCWLLFKRECDIISQKTVVIFSAMRTLHLIILPSVIIQVKMLDKY